MAEDKKKKVNKKQKATKAVRKLINETEEKLKDTIKLARESVRLYKKESKRNINRPLKSQNEKAYNDWLNNHPKLKNHQNHFNDSIKRASDFFQQYKDKCETNKIKPRKIAWKIITRAYLKNIDLNLKTFYETLHKDKNTKQKKSKT